MKFVLLLALIAIVISNTDREPGLAFAAQTVLLLLDKLLKGWLHFREPNS